MPVSWTQSVEKFTRETAEVAEQVAYGSFVAFRGFLNASKHLLDSPTATSDLLNLFNRVVKLVGQTYQPIACLAPFTRAFQNITDFVSARSFIERLSNFVNGESVRNPLTRVQKDFVLIARESVKLVSDFCSTARWLKSINAMAAEILEKPLSLSVLGKEVYEGKLLQTVGDTAVLAGGSLGLIHTVRVVSIEGWSTPRVLDVVLDITKIAATILSRYTALASIALRVLVVASVASMTKFVIKELGSNNPPSPPAAPLLPSVVAAGDGTIRV